MSRRLWVMAFLLLIRLPSISTKSEVLSSAQPPPPSSRRVLATSTAPAMSTIADCSNSSSAGSCVSDSSIGSNWPSILPRSKTLTTIVVVIFVACIVMAFFSVYARKYCLMEVDSNGRYGGVKSAQYMQELVASLPLVRYGAIKGEAGGSEAAGMGEEGLKARRECAVCLSEFEEGEELRLLPACAHLFHKDCIDKWLASHTTCPLCRVSLLPTAQKSFCSDAINPAHAVDLQRTLAPPAAATSSA